MADLSDFAKRPARPVLSVEDVCAWMLLTVVAVAWGLAGSAVVVYALDTTFSPWPYVFTASPAKQATYDFVHGLRRVEPAPMSVPLTVAFSEDFARG